MMWRESQAKVVLGNPAEELNSESRNELFFYLFLNNKAVFLAVDSTYT